MKTNICLFFCFLQTVAVIGQQKTVIPCNDNEIVTSFSKVIKPAEFHEYTVGPTKVCNTKENPPGCSRDFVYKI